ncbi:MAG: hypothetical protein QM695_05620 [Micropruina sp.]
MPLVQGRGQRVDLPRADGLVESGQLDNLEIFDSFEKERGGEIRPVTRTEQTHAFSHTRYAQRLGKLGRIHGEPV